MFEVESTTPPSLLLLACLPAYRDSACANIVWAFSNSNESLADPVRWPGLYALLAAVCPIKGGLGTF